jgi:hypothetical protein
MSAFPLEALFSIAGSLALAGWLALALIPLRYHAPRYAAIAAAIVIAMLYAGLIGAFWAQGEGGFGSLADVALLFEHPGLLLAGWVHYLAFDLLVGVWERDQARRIGLPQWALAPCLVLTFLLGPLGWLVFLAVRFFRLKAAPLAAASHGK